MSVIVYDRGDGYLSLIPFDFFLQLSMTDGIDSFISFLSIDVPKINYKKLSVGRVVECLSSKANLLNKCSINSNEENKLLTKKDEELIRLLLTGVSVNTIAYINRVSPGAIFSRKYKILEKLSVTSLAQIIKMHGRWRVVLRGRR